MYVPVNTSGQGTFAAAHLKALTQPFAEFLINYKLGIAWWNKSHQVHKCVRPATNSKSFVQLFCIVFTFVFWVVDNTWNWV